MPRVATVCISMCLVPNANTPIASRMNSLDVDIGTLSRCAGNSTPPPLCSRVPSPKDAEFASAVRGQLDSIFRGATSSAVPGASNWR